MRVIGNPGGPREDQKPEPLGREMVEEERSAIIVVHVVHSHQGSPIRDCM